MILKIIKKLTPLFVKNLTLEFHLGSMDQFYYKKVNMILKRILKIKLVFT